MTSPIPIAFFFGGAPGMGETLAVLVIALLLFGTKRLPGIARNLGRAMEEFRRAARDITQEVMHAETESTPLDEPKKLPSTDRPAGTIEQNGSGVADEGPPADDDA